MQIDDKNDDVLSDDGDECHVCGVHYDLVECPYHSELHYRSVPCCATCAQNCKQDI